MAKSLAVRDVQGSLVLHGILALVFGFTAVFWPSLTLQILVYLFGVYILVAGVLHVVHGMSTVDKADWWFLNAVLGVVELGFGVYLLRHPSVTFKTFILLVGLALIIRGVIELVSSLFSEVGNSISRTLTVLAGLLAIVAGIIVLDQKQSAGVAFVWILGVYAIVVGAMQVAVARKLGE